MKIILQMVLFFLRDWFDFMKPKQKSKPDIVDVENAAGVSISTVSRNFNHPNLLKPATRKKIDRAVQKLGYIRNRAAQVMHGRRSSTIGLVVPTIDTAIFVELIQPFSDGLDRRGFTMLIASHGFDLGPVDNHWAAMSVAVRYQLAA